MTGLKPVVSRPGRGVGRGDSGAGSPDSSITLAVRKDGLRRRLLVWSAVPALLVLCIAAKLLSLGPLAGHAAHAFDAKDAAGAGMAAKALQPGNMVERHKAPFAAGDAEALAGDYAAARLRFEEALGLVPDAQAGSPDACVIRLNLVLAIERLGDEKSRQDGPAQAAALFSEALEAAGAAPEGCFGAGGADGAGDKLTQAEGRLKEKLEAATANSDGQGSAAGEDAPDEPKAQDQLEQLEDRARESQRERNSGRERKEYLEDSRSSAGPDRPW
ncbi:conserved hypothetical protein [Arthrobacter sp. 9AX]|uniref:hypothetical protein n=1 Tax=Arthrobacter sp. 9AX TaxID=2653131 RepID=UPI0012EF063C|nr:hypothetical protein [Arthrobacter sp. 9AX]VXB43205.1 conserved hypothetical protein [Arthrobacter sp. 9AX]